MYSPDLLLCNVCMTCFKEMSSVLTQPKLWCWEHSRPSPSARPAWGTSPGRQEIRWGTWRRGCPPRSGSFQRNIPLLGYPASSQILDYVNNLVHLGLLQVSFAGQTNLFSHEPGTGHRLTDLLAVPSPNWEWEEFRRPWLAWELSSLWLDPREEESSHPRTWCHHKQAKSCRALHVLGGWSKSASH